MNNDQSPILTEGLILHLFESGLLSKESLGLDEDRLRKIYAHGKKLYDSSNYEQSRQVFSMLTLLESNNPSYLYGLASSAMMLDDIDLALNAFQEYSVLMPNDPTPYFYSASCCEKKNDPISALIHFEAAVLVAKDQPQFQGIKQRALLAIENYAQSHARGKPQV